MLMCRSCWALVPRAIQIEVYRTVKLRASSVDATWAPWWKAAHRAIAENAVVREIFTDERAKAYVAHHDELAETFKP